ncbi:MAG: hypothetical protein WD276_05390 [Actinomycetota bacterium]
MGTASLTLTGRRPKIAVLTAVVLAAAVALAATAQEDQAGASDGVTLGASSEEAAMILDTEIDEVKADLDALSKEPPILEVRAREDYLNSRLDFLNFVLAEQCSQVSDSKPEACP